VSEAASETASSAGAGASTTPIELVERFLELLRREDIVAATELLAGDVEYANVGLPTVYGRKRVRQVLQATLGLNGARFEVYVHTISASGSSVLTERTDVLEYRRLRLQFWVCGRFDVRDGQIVLWRDYFDQANIFLATLRGLLGIALPSLRAKPPAS
jgi:limonene-1,2-epoxide hydrolase